jgi:hypothetical protein
MGRKRSRYRGCDSFRSVTSGKGKKAEGEEAGRLPARLDQDKFRPAVACCAAEGNPAIRRDPAALCQSGMLRRHHPRPRCRKFPPDRSATFACRGVGNPLGQEFAGFFWRHSSTGFSVPNTFIDGGERLLLLVAFDRSRSIQLYFLRLSQAGIAVLISVLCKRENGPRATNVFRPASRKVLMP